jgi:[protein-PII] uridylyltransferase
MSDYAQKRDISDPRTVVDFARIVETPERLRLLLVLTVADIRAVGPGVWNGWKGQLLRELYRATEALFRGGRGAEDAAAIRRYHENAAYDARMRLAGSSPALTEWAQSMEDAYFTAFTDDEVRAHGALVRRAAETGAATACRIRPDMNAAEVSVSATDRPRLFADLAGALTQAGANVLGARVHTSRRGEALDVFFVQDASGAAFGADNPRALDRLMTLLEAAGRGEPLKRDGRPAPELGRAAAFAITPTVMLDNEASEAATRAASAARCASAAAVRARSTSGRATVPAALPAASASTSACADATACWSKACTSRARNTAQYASLAATSTSVAAAA